MAKGIPTASVVLVALTALSTQAFSQSFTASAPVQLSVGVGNVAPDNESDELVLSPNSGIAAFKSIATNLVPNDNNQQADVFIRSADGVITRASVSGNGDEADLGGRGVALSQVAASGAFGVAFLSRSTNLVQGLTSAELGVDQIYLRVPTAGKTFLISRAYQGSGFVGATANCEFPSVVALENGAKFLVAFHSNADNLVQGAVPPGNGASPRLKRIFFATLTVATGELKMEAFTGLKGGPPANGDLVEPVLSGLGDQMLFRTNASNLGWPSSGSFLYQVALAKKDGGVELVSKSPEDGSPGTESSDSHWMTFNVNKIVFKTASTNILDGTSASPSLVLYNTGNKKYSLINANKLGVRGNGYSGNEPVRIDPNGLVAMFIDGSSNYLLDGSDTNQRPDVFVKDLQTNTITRVNVSATGAQEENGYTGGASLGLLGFSSLTATVGFHSSSTILRQTGGGPSSFVREVYRVQLAFPAPVLTTNTRIETPPDLKPGVRKILLTMKKFSSGVAPSSSGSVRSMATPVKYEIELTRRGTNKKLKLVSSRNRVVLRNLTPGKYAVRYRVSGKTAAGKKVRTKWSPSAPVTVRKR